MGKKWKFRQSKRGESTTTRQKIDGLVGGLLIGSLAVVGAVLVANGLAKIEIK